MQDLLDDVVCPETTFGDSFGGNGVEMGVHIECSVLRIDPYCNGFVMGVLSVVEIEHDDPRRDDWSCGDVVCGVHHRHFHVDVGVSLSFHSKLALPTDGRPFDHEIVCTLLIRSEIGCSFCGIPCPFAVDVQSLFRVHHDDLL